MKIPIVKDVNVKGKFVMVRAGLDVPLDQKKDLLDPKRVTDNIRIIDIIPTLKYCIENEAYILLAAGWCGRPKGVDPDFSMAPVAKNLEQELKKIGRLKHPVLIAPNCYEDETPKNVYGTRMPPQQKDRTLHPGSCCPTRIRYFLQQP